MQEFLLDFCSSKESRITQSSLESDVALLTSGEGSDPSMLGYDDCPPQMSADAGISCSTSEKGQRFVQSSNFGLVTKFGVLFLELTQSTRRSWHRALTGHHPCHILVHLCCCSVYCRYRSNVFVHRSGRCVGHGGKAPAEAASSMEHPLCRAALWCSAERSLARLKRRRAACSYLTSSSSRRTPRMSEFS